MAKSMQSAAEANPLANLKQELGLNHSMVMDQLNRLTRDVNRVKPTLEELQAVTQRRADRLKEEVTDELVGLSGRLSDMERSLQEQLEGKMDQIQQRLMERLDSHIKDQEKALGQITGRLEELSRHTTANLAQLRMALAMAEVEADLRARHEKGPATSQTPTPEAVPSAKRITDNQDKNR